MSDNDGQTALFISLCEGYRECVDILIDAGSSLKIVTKVTHHTHTHNITPFPAGLACYVFTTSKSYTILH